LCEEHLKGDNLKHNTVVAMFFSRVASCPQGSHQILRDTRVSRRPYNATARLASQNSPNSRDTSLLQLLFDVQNWKTLHKMLFAFIFLLMKASKSYAPNVFPRETRKITHRQTEPR